MFRSALLILSGNAATSLLLLARNLIVARMIPVADYGIAATFAISMAVVEMMSALGLQQQIVQAKDGDAPRFQAALQGFSLLRGALAAAALFAIAGPLATFLGVPEVAWAYRVLALVPLLNAAAHFDIHRLNRQMRFAPLILTGGVPALVSVLLLWPLGQWFGDWQVMLWAILAQAAVALITSHLVAERRYAIAFDRAVIARVLRFGWPLLANGVLLFLVFQGDKLLVGRVLGMEPLAVFAMGVTLTLTPTLVMAKSVQSLFLPRLSALPEGNGFDRMARLVLGLALLNGVVLVLAVMALGAPLVSLLLGAKYQALIPLLSALAVLQAFRVFKSGSTVVALARGHSANAMVANLFRVASLPLVAYALIRGEGLILVIWIGTIAEALGYGASLWMLRQRPGLRLGPLWPALMLSLGVLLAAGLGYAWLALAFSLPFLASLPDLRQCLIRRLTQKDAP